MDAPGSLDSAKTGHTDIQNHHTRLKLFCPTHAVQPIGSLAYDTSTFFSSISMKHPCAKRLNDLGKQNIHVISDSIAKALASIPHTV